MDLVKWKRAGTSTNYGDNYTLWHISTMILANRRGRVGCGKYYPRRSRPQYRPLGKDEPWPEHMCKSCQIAWNKGKHLAADDVHAKPLADEGGKIQMTDMDTFDYGWRNTDEPAQSESR